MLHRATLNAFPTSKIVKDTGEVNTKKKVQKTETNKLINAGASLSSSAFTSIFVENKRINYKQQKNSRLLRSPQTNLLLVSEKNNGHHNSLPANIAPNDQDEVNSTGLESLSTATTEMEEPSFENDYSSFSENIFETTLDPVNNPFMKPSKIKHKKETILSSRLSFKISYSLIPGKALKCLNIFL